MKSKLTSLAPEASIVFLALSINLYSVTTIWTPTQGWYLEWAKSLENSLLYNSTYVPLPPAFIVLTLLTTKIGIPILFATRILDLIIFVTLALGIFKYFGNFTNKSFALIVASFSIILFEIDPANTISGYFEFAMSCVVWGLHFFLEDKGKKSAFFAGCLISIGALTKQIYIFPLLAIAIYDLINIRSGKLNSSARTRLLGLLLPQVVFFLYLINTNSFQPFITSMLEGGGKNPSFNHLIGWFFKPLLSPLSIKNSAIIAIIILLSYKLNENTMVARIRKYVILVALNIFLFFPIDYIFQNLKSLLSSKIFFMISFCYLITFLKLRINQLVFLFFVLASSTTCFLFFEKYTLDDNYLEKLKALNRNFQNYYLAISQAAATISLALLILFLCKFRNNVDLNNKKLAVLSGLIFTGLINVLNGGFSYIVNIPILGLGVLYTLNRKTDIKKLERLSSAAMIFLVSSVFLVQFNLYSWYGWEEKFNPHTTSLQEKAKLPSIFEGMQLTQYESKLYSSIYQQIQNAESSISKPNTYISLPMQPIFNYFFTGNQLKLKCPIMHFDVCPDRVLKEDFSYIKKNSPNLVIYFDSGDDFIQQNEVIWRDGNISVYRKLRSYFLQGDQYVIIKKWNKDSQNLSDIYLLKRKSKYL